MSVSRPYAAAFVAGHHAPLIDERAATRGRSATEGGDVRAGATPKRPRRIMPALTPGSGNIGIAAHRDTYFRPLRAIRANDVVALKTPAGTSRYAVTEATIVRPSDVGVLTRAPGRDLTLVTCYPFFYVGSSPESAED
jgi:hypothetical protein